MTQHSYNSANYYLQVLSGSVAKAFDYYGDREIRETQRFVATFDKFFDCLNVRSPQEHIKRLKPNLKPYETTDDVRLSVSSLNFARWCYFVMLLFLLLSFLIVA